MEVSTEVREGTVDVIMEVDSESNYMPEEKVTYEKIREYTLEKHGLKVSSLWDYLDFKIQNLQVLALLRS